MKNAIILCSGGIDSVTTAHYVQKKLKYKRLTLLFFNYQQKSLIKERDLSRLCCKELNGEFIEINLKELSLISTSLINREGDIKKFKTRNLQNTKKESEKFYVPFRNSIFLIYALAIAESKFIKNKEVNDIFVGFKCEGKEPYPDTTKDYLKIINDLGKKSIGKFKIFAPFIKKDKEDIILIGKRLGIDFSRTFSCYVNNKKHCGYCLACKLRQEGFYWANLKDPTEYSK